ncbi:MAG: OsmC family protein [Anaerolineales bacterium]|jgi:ribosomal protein S12 methylthiotransferase accessory factor
MKIYFPGGRRINAEYKGYTIETDQSTRSGGEGLHPNPLDLFKASLGTCIGYYVMCFCLEREIPLDWVHLEVDFQEDGVIETVGVQIVVDPQFPEKYLCPIVKATESCKIKKQLIHPPAYEIDAVYAEG